MKIRWVSENFDYMVKFLMYQDDGLFGDLHGHVIVTSINDEILKGKNIGIGEVIPQSTFKLHQHEAHELIQSFIDEAWEKGHKPSKLKKNTKEWEAERVAVERHLSDMRILLFNKEGIRRR